jgi:PhnB protein
MTTLNPYLTFNGNAREAMTFYQQCLGGELTMQTVAEAPAAYRCPEGQENHLMHAMLVKDQLVLMASDMVGQWGFKPGNTMAIMVNCSSEEETRNFFGKLSQGGQVTDPLRDMFWGDLFGALQDKFGVAWIFNFARNQKTA